MDMLGALIAFVIVVLIVVAIAAILLWAVGKFFPEGYQPARLIIGVVALIAILVALYRTLTGGRLLDL
jgi:uncharacterized BrkB/YihY/UPF0761 family membrane protein